MIYLNDVQDDAGCRTRFYNEDKLIVDFDYYPKTGDCMCLHQEKLHEGEVLKNGLKYILRTEVLYITHN